MVQNHWAAGWVGILVRLTMLIRACPLFTRGATLLSMRVPYAKRGCL